MDTLKHIQDKFKVDITRSVIKLSIDKYNGLPSLFAELGFKTGAEIGVNRGKYSKWLLYKMRKNKPKLFLVDPYLAYYDAQFGKPIYFDQAKQDECYEKACVRLAKFNCEFIKKSSVEASKDFLNNSLDFVYIDGDHHFEFVVNDIAEWSKKIKPGGIVSGHDYSGMFFPVREAVNAWVKIHKIKPLFLTWHANWFYVKS